MLLSLSGVPDLGSRSAKPSLKPTQPLVVVKTASKHIRRFSPLQEIQKSVQICRLLDGNGSVAQHFLLSAAARTLTLASVVRMSDEEVERVFIRLRWADNGGDAYCPHCCGTTVYMVRRPNGSARWRCKACHKDFSITSGTLFASHK